MGTVRLVTGVNGPRITVNLPVASLRLAVEALKARVVDYHYHAAKDPAKAVHYRQQADHADLCAEAIHRAIAGL
jgi:hypothetical protein